MRDRKHPRFVTDRLNVTGDSPELLEAAVLARVSEMSGVDEALLEVSNPYTIGTVDEPDTTTAPAGLVELARERGHRLFARIYVICWREVSDEPRCVDRGAGSPADPADLRAEAAPDAAG